MPGVRWVSSLLDFFLPAVRQISHVRFAYVYMLLYIYIYIAYMYSYIYIYIYVAIYELAENIYRFMFMWTCASDVFFC